MLRIKLSKARVMPGKTERVNEWMKMLNDNLPAALLTLEDERMYVEAIFRELVGEEEFLYWFSIQGEDGISVHESKHEIDHRHIAYARECIDRSYKRVDLLPQVAMLPEWLREAIHQHSLDSFPKTPRS